MSIQMNQEARVEIMWLLVRLLCYMPRPEDVPDDKRGFVEYDPLMLTEVAARANDLVHKIRSGQV